MHAFLEDAVKIADISESAVARNLADRLLGGKQQPAALGNPQVIDIRHGGNMHNRLKKALSLICNWLASSAISRSSQK